MLCEIDLWVKEEVYLKGIVLLTGMRGHGVWRERKFNRERR